MGKTTKKEKKKYGIKTLQNQIVALKPFEITYWIDGAPKSEPYWVKKAMIIVLEVACNSDNLFSKFQAEYIVTNPNSDVDWSTPKLCR